MGRSYTPLFLDDERVVAGKQMEAIRESVEDYEYFVMLCQAVDRAKKAGRSDAAVARAESLLKTGAQAVLSAPGVDQIHWHDPKDRTKAEQAVRFEQEYQRLQEAPEPESSPERRAALEEFRWLLEEFKVSLFAPELKTAVTVSPKRLSLKLKSIAEIS